MNPRIHVFTMDNVSHIFGDNQTLLLSSSKDANISIKELEYDDIVVIDLRTQEIINHARVPIYINEERVETHASIAFDCDIFVGTSKLNYCGGTPFKPHVQALKDALTLRQSKKEQYQNLDKLFGAPDGTISGGTHQQQEHHFQLSALPYEQQLFVQPQNPIKILQSVDNAAATLEAINSSEPLETSEYSCPEPWAKDIEEYHWRNLSFEDKDNLLLRLEKPPTRKVRIGEYGSMTPFRNVGYMSVYYMIDQQSNDLVVYVTTKLDRRQLAKKLPHHTEAIYKNDFFPTAEELTMIAHEVIFQKPGEWVVIPPRYHMSIALSSSSTVITWEFLPFVLMKHVLLIHVPELQSFCLKDTRGLKRMIVESGKKIKDKGHTSLHKSEWIFDGLSILGEELKLDDKRFKQLSKTIKTIKTLPIQPVPSCSKLRCSHCRCSAFGKLIELAYGGNNTAYLCMPCATHLDNENEIGLATKVHVYEAASQLEQLVIALKQAL